MWLPSTTTSSPSTSVISLPNRGLTFVSIRWKRMPTSICSTPWNTSAGTRWTRSSLWSPYASSGVTVAENLSPATFASSLFSRPVLGCCDRKGNSAYFRSWLVNYYAIFKFHLICATLTTTFFQFSCESSKEVWTKLEQLVLQHPVPILWGSINETQSFLA